MLKARFKEANPEADAIRARLRDEFQVRSMLMPMATVARLVGVAPCTLHAYIRDGIFFMPYRRVNKTPMVAVDDFVAWWCSPKESGADL